MTHWLWFYNDCLVGKGGWKDCPYGPLWWGSRSLWLVSISGVRESFICVDCVTPSILWPLWWGSRNSWLIPISGVRDSFICVECVTHSYDWCMRSSWLIYVTHWCGVRKRSPSDRIRSFCLSQFEKTTEIILCLKFSVVQFVTWLFPPSFFFMWSS